LVLLAHSNSILPTAKRTTVLSFPLTDDTGEIFICPQVAVKEAAKYDLSVAGYVAYLFIHGVLHLKGLDHSDEMEKQEKRYLRKYDIV
jgi:rRNA maturation RNase YbeY